MFPNNKNKMLITGGSASSAVYTLEYNPRTNKVSIVRLENDMNEKRSNHCLVYCNNGFYALGGDGGAGFVLKSCEKL